ncbi:hypothetical protein D9M68_718970 [compost metagenome]
MADDRCVALAVITSVPTRLWLLSCWLIWAAAALGTSRAVGPSGEVVSRIALSMPEMAAVWVSSLLP